MTPLDVLHTADRGDDRRAPVTRWQRVRDVLVPPMPPDPVQQRLDALEAQVGLLTAREEASRDHARQLTARLDRAEQALRDSGRAPCQVCDAWRLAQQGPEVLLWGPGREQPCCRECVPTLLADPPADPPADPAGRDWLRAEVASWLAAHHARSHDLAGRCVQADPDLMAYVRARGGAS